MHTADALTVLAIAEASVCLCVVRHTLLYRVNTMHTKITTRLASSQRDLVLRVLRASGNAKRVTTPIESTKSEKIVKNCDFCK